MPPQGCRAGLSHHNCLTHWRCATAPHPKAARAAKLAADAVKRASDAADNEAMAEVCTQDGGGGCVQGCVDFTF
jgi:hypothetical protein